MENNILKTKKQDFTFRNEVFNIDFHYYIDEVNGYEYTTDELNKINTEQLYNQYNLIHSLKTEEDYRNALLIIEPLLLKSFDSLTKAEDEKLVEITKLIDDYEELHYSLPFKKEQ